jgi:hypothetical protein
MLDHLEEFRWAPSIKAKPSEQFYTDARRSTSASFPKWRAPCTIPQPHVRCPWLPGLSAPRSSRLAGLSSPASAITLSTFALTSRNAAAPLAARSSVEASGACAPPEEPCGLEDDGYVDRAVLVISIDSIVNMIQKFRTGSQVSLGSPARAGRWRRDVPASDCFAARSSGQFSHSRAHRERADREYCRAQIAIDNWGLGPDTRLRRWSSPCGPTRPATSEKRWQLFLIAGPKNLRLLLSRPPHR